MDKITLKEINNPLEDTTSDVRLIDNSDNKSLLKLCNLYIPDLSNHLVFHNRKLIQLEELDTTFVTKGDYILVVPKTEGGADGGGILKMAAMMALAIVAIYAGQWYMAPELISPTTGAIVGGGLGGSAFGASLLTAGVMMAGGMLINAVIPPISQDNTASATGSTSYSWKPTTTQQQGLPWQKYYGISKASGNIITTYEETISDKSYTHILTDFGLGPNFGLSDITINDAPYTTFYSSKSKNFKINTRVGDLDQSVIEDFMFTKLNKDLFLDISVSSKNKWVKKHIGYRVDDEIISTNPTLYPKKFICTAVNKTLPATGITGNTEPIWDISPNGITIDQDITWKENGDYPYYFITDSSNFDRLEIDINFPDGLYTTDTTGSMQYETVSFSVYIKEKNETEWMPITFRVVPDNYTDPNYTWLNYCVDNMIAYKDTIQVQGSHPFKDGQEVVIFGGVYQPPPPTVQLPDPFNILNGKSFFINVINATTFTINNPGVKIGSKFTVGNYEYPEYYMRNAGAPSSEVNYGNGQWSAGFYVENIWYQAEIGSTDISDHLDGQFYQSDDFINKQATWQWFKGTKIVAKYLEQNGEGYYYSNVANNTLSAFIHTFKSPLIEKKGQYEIKIWRWTPKDPYATYTGSKAVVNTIRQVLNEDFSYPRQVLLGVRAVATEKLSGSFSLSSIIKGALVKTYHADEVIDPTDGFNYRCKTNLTSTIEPHLDIYNVNTNPTGHWEQKGHNGIVWKTGGDYSSTPIWRVEYSNNPAWVCYDILTQPVYNNSSIVLWSDNNVYRCTTDHISSTNNQPLSINGYKYWILDNRYITKTNWSSNKIYTGYDFIRYEGSDSDRLNLTDFRNWADFCDVLVSNGKDGYERRFEFNGGFESETNLWEAALQVCAMSRATLVWNGITLNVILDQIAIPVQLFSSGNIIQDSFEETFLSMEERTGELEIIFNNAEKNYERDTFLVFNPDLDTSSNKTSLNLIGVTKPSQAWRTGRFALLCNQYQKRIIKFDASIDAIACTIGDVIYFQHDVTKWGQSGSRIKAINSNTVTLSEPIIMETGKNYSLLTRIYDPLQEIEIYPIKEVYTFAGTTSTVTIKDSWSISPSIYDVYSFGETNSEAKKFRITNIEKSQDQVVTIEAIEYNDNIYLLDEDEPTIPETTFKSISSLKIVTGLSTIEQNTHDESGNLKKDIIVSYNIPENSFFRRGRIFYKDINNENSEYEESSYINRISNIKTNTTYKIIVVSESYTGKTTDIDFSPFIYITTTGYNSGVISNPSVEYEVKGLQIFNQGNSYIFEGKDCKFSWYPASIISSNYDADGEPDGASTDKNSTQYFKDYEVKIYDENGNLRRTEYVTDTFYTYTFEKNSEDGNGTSIRVFQIQVKARDINYNISTKANKLLVENPIPNEVDFTLDSSVLSFTINITPSEDTDIQGYSIYASKISGFTPDATTLINTGVETSFIKTCSASEIGTWYIKVMPYDCFGEILTTTTESSITVIDENPLDGIPPAIPTGLSLSTAIDSIGQNNTSYIEATWNTNSETDFANYILQLQKSIETKYIEYFETNTKHKFSGLVSGVTYTVKIKAVDKWSNNSDYSAGVSLLSALDTTPPAIPTGLVTTTGFKKVIITFNSNTEADLAGYEVHVSTSSGFTPDNATLKSKGLNTLVSFDGAVNTTYYVKIRAYDWSGNYSDYTTQSSVTTSFIESSDINSFVITASKIYTKIPIITGDTWTDNSPTSGFIAWNEHKLYYNGVEYTITAGNTNNKYIYWDGSSSYDITNTNPALTDSQFIIATNLSGIHDLAWNALANEVIGSAYIQNAAIINAKIADLAVDSAKIALATITDAQISSLSVDKVTAGSMNITWSGGNIRSGQTAYNTGTGFWLGNSGGTAKFSIGDPTGQNITWDGSILSITGTMTILPGTVVPWADISGKPTSLTDISSSEGIKLSGIEDNATVGATWGTNLLSIPSVLTTPTGTGLFLSASSMGYYSGGSWKTYIDNTGNMFLGDILGGNSGLSWNQSSGILSIIGTITARSGSFGDSSNRIVVESTGLNIGSTGSIKGGQTAYDNGIGFWLGNVTGTPKFSIGNSSGNKLLWDGTTLSVNGKVAGTIQDTLSISTSGSLSSGQTAYNTGTGFWLEYNGGTPRFSLGSSTKYLKWDGSTLGIRGDLNASDIITGDLTSVNVIAGTFMTKGTRLVASCTTGQSTLDVEDITTLYNTGTPHTSGSGWIIDVGNDRDYITWTGVSGNTLTGVIGLLTHTVGSRGGSNNPILVPKRPSIIMTDVVNDLRIFGDRSDGVIKELISLGDVNTNALLNIGDVDVNYRAGYFDSCWSETVWIRNSGVGNALIVENTGDSETPGNGNEAIRGTSTYDGGIYGWSLDHIGVKGESTNGNGGYFSAGLVKGSIGMNFYEHTNLPTDRSVGQIIVVHNTSWSPDYRVCYSEGTNWRLIDGNTIVS